MVSFVNATVVEVVAEDTVPVTFPINVPSNALAIRVPVVKLYDNERGLVSTYSGRAPVPVVMFI